MAISCSHSKRKERREEEFALILTVVRHPVRRKARLLVCRLFPLSLLGLKCREKREEEEGGKKPASIPVVKDEERRRERGSRDRLLCLSHISQGEREISTLPLSLSLFFFHSLLHIRETWRGRSTNGMSMTFFFSISFFRHFMYTFYWYSLFVSRESDD